MASVIFKGRKEKSGRRRKKKLYRHHTAMSMMPAVCASYSLKDLCFSY